ncbi:MAG: sigma-70 family RNA polymerase sigma factor [Gemmataceae bacterium]
MSSSSDPTPSFLEQISTRWPLLSEPNQFVLRYAPAIRRYLTAMLRDEEAVHDVSQTFLMRVLDQRFQAPANLRGRFRDYLKAAIRNAALTHFRETKRKQTSGLEFDVEDERGTREADAAWTDEWRRCLLDRVWQSLERHERRGTGNYAYTVLKLYLDHPDLDSVELAERTSQKVAAEMKPEAYRKQLSRARRLFATTLIQETARTLEHPSREGVSEELGDLGLWADVEPYLPDDWSPLAAK